MEFLYQYGLFMAKSFSLLLAIVGGLLVLLLVIARQKQKPRKGQLLVTDLSAEFRQTQSQLNTLFQPTAPKKAWYQRLKREPESVPVVTSAKGARLFVIDFKGGLEAKEVASLREEVTAILAIARDEDEVLVRLESGGGVVHGYGLGASQLARIRTRGLTLTVAIDKVAASGGYMMACVAQQIVAAPFAVVGSIGVVAQLPNFHRLLKKHDIDFEQHTAGEFKRTLTLFGENDDKARKKFQLELESVHQQFKQFIAEHRPALDMGRVATGEHWLAHEAKALGLVDVLQTSDDYLLSRYPEQQVVKLTYQLHKPMAERLAHLTSQAIEGTFWRLWQAVRTPFLG